MAITPITPTSEAITGGMAAVASLTRPKGMDTTATVQKKSWGLLR